MYGKYSKQGNNQVYKKEKESDETGKSWTSVYSGYV